MNDAMIKLAKDILWGTLFISTVLVILMIQFTHENVTNFLELVRSRSKITRGLLKRHTVQGLDS